MIAQSASLFSLVGYNSSKSSLTARFLQSPPHQRVQRRRMTKSRWSCLGMLCIPLYALLYSVMLQQHRRYDTFGEAESTAIWTPKRALMEYKQVENNDTEAFTKTSIPRSRQPHRNKLPERHISGLQFIHTKELRQRDYFSDSWLINRQRFLEIDVEMIRIVEDAAFSAVGNSSQTPHSYAKMTYDWADFAVEHLSKWWGILKRDRGRIINHVIGMLERYMKEKVIAPSNSPESLLPPALSKTIAIVAFAPYKIKSKWLDPNGSKGWRFTSYSLAATIASLYQVGFGRVVVVGVTSDDMRYVRNAVGILTQIYGESLPDHGKNSINDNTICQLGSTKMEIAFVHVTDPAWISNGIVERNIPRAAIVGLRLAMTDKLNTTDTIKWLGSHKNVRQHWDNVYLTEPDTILHIRQELLPQFQVALQDGISLFPHRLHPLPHEADLPRDHTLNRGLYIPNVGHFANISVIDTFTNVNEDKKSDIQKDASVLYTSCCDHGGAWPGHDGWERKEECRPWWMCGFSRIDLGPGETYNETMLVERHERLQLYPMMVSY
jgi:hypothetical protein